MNNAPHMLHTSLLRARLGAKTTAPSTEHQLMDYLCAAVGMPDTALGDLVRAIYVGIKAQFAVCVCGMPVLDGVALLDAFAAAIVGTGSEQIVKLAVPPLDEDVARRFAALRIAEVVASALDDRQRDQAFFVLVHGDDAPALMDWTYDEIRAALHAETPHHDAWPANIVVLGAAPSAPPRALRPWLLLGAPATMPAPVARPSVVPPVGYQRQLVANRLRGAGASWQPPTGTLLGQHGCGLPPVVAWQWLAAAVDKHGRGLWVPDDLHQNAEQALAVLHAFATPAASRLKPTS